MRTVRTLRAPEFPGDPSVLTVLTVLTSTEIEVRTLFLGFRCPEWKFLGPPKIHETTDTKGEARKKSQKQKFFSNQFEKLLLSVLTVLTKS